MRNLILFLACFSLIPLSMSCSSPAAPEESSTPGGRTVAWFNGLGYTVDLYFMDHDSLVRNAYLTGEVPSDILSPEKNLVAVLSSFDSRIRVFDVNRTGSESFHVNLPSGGNPYQMCLDNDGHAWVTLLLSSQVARAELTEGGDVTLFDVDPNPTSIASDGNLIFVGHGNWPDTTVSGGVSVRNSKTGEEIAWIETPDNVCFMKYFPATGKIHAVTTTYSNDGAVTVIDPNSFNAVGTVRTGGSPGAPIKTGSGFIAGDGWSSGKLFFYDESGKVSSWNSGHASATGLAAIGDTLFVTDFKGNMVFTVLLPEMIILDTLQSGTKGPQGITVVPR